MNSRYLSEFLGTFALVFTGTGAIIANDFSGGAITNVGIALTFGLTVMVIIYAVGDISGGHLNPAVTIGFWLASRLPHRQVIPYILSQVAGGLLASIILRTIFDQHPALGATLPAISPASTFVLEVVLAFLLMFVIIHVSSGVRDSRIMAGVAIGGTVGLEAMFAGPITGASMNPARSLAPALVSSQLDHLWIYLIAPFIGAVIAAIIHRIIRPEAYLTGLVLEENQSLIR